MLQDLIKIKPESKRNYHPGKYEFATPVEKPKDRARFYFQWGLIFHAKKKPAEAYRYYEKAICHHKNPLYLKQMAILHHEMGYLREALQYIRVAVDIERKQQMEREREVKRRKYLSRSSTLKVPFYYTSSYSYPSGSYSERHHDASVISPKICYASAQQ